MRLIDADALINDRENFIVIGAGDNICIDISDIAKAPTIDADDLLAEYDRRHDGEPGRARKLIEDAPTIDRPTRSQFKRMAVQLGYEPVAHCKDCRLGEPDMIVNGYKDDFWCKYYEHPKPADGFCEKGKRKDDFVDDNKIGERRTEKGNFW